LAFARRAVARLRPPSLRAAQVGSPVSGAGNPFDPAELYGIIPQSSRKPYDVHELIARLVDGAWFDEFKALYGTTLVCGFADIHGTTVGILASNSSSCAAGRGFPWCSCKTFPASWSGKPPRPAASPKMAPSS
jgi:3-methylcrotonyl-CoA carboxylase beta subunit